MALRKADVDGARALPVEPRDMRKLLISALVGTLSLSSTGCIKSMLTNGQISATREASGVFQSIGDYDLARSAAQAGLVQFEGMHKLSPDNEDALAMLLESWTGYGFAFADDDYEAAKEGTDDDLAEYHRRRARLAYDRAVEVGKELMSHEDSGFETARRNEATLKAWLNEHFSDKEDAHTLYWFGGAWLLRVDLMQDDPAYVADLFVGVAFLEQAYKVDPSFEHYGAEGALATYHARAAIAELDQAKTMFEDTLAKTQRKSLIVQVNYAARYACLKNDRALYEKLLNEVLAASDDLDPEQRLPNTVAKRRAKRYLGKQHMMDCGFDMSAPSSGTPAPAAAPAPAPTPAPAASSAPATPAPGASAKPATPAPGASAKPATPAPGASAKPATAPKPAASAAPKP